MPTIQQRRARTALAVDVGPAIVWTRRLVQGPCGPIEVSTDTSPGLDLYIWTEGGISTPRYADARERMREAMADDEHRVLRIVGEMMSAAASAREAVTV